MSQTEREFSVNCLSFLLCISTKFAFFHSDENIPWTRHEFKINFRGLYFTLTYRFNLDSVFTYSNSIFTFRFITYYEHTKKQNIFTVCFIWIKFADYFSDTFWCEENTLFFFLMLARKNEKVMYFHCQVVNTVLQKVY